MAPMAKRLKNSCFVGAPKALMKPPARAEIIRSDHSYRSQTKTDLTAGVNKADWIPLYVKVRMECQRLKDQSLKRVCADKPRYIRI